MLNIDGSSGEGGGQIVRTSLAMAMLTGESIRLQNIRAKRKKPGLKRQHLTGVRAAAAISDATVSGAQLESSTLDFRPGRIRGGAFRFDIGSAGSAMLVLQTVLPALLAAPTPSSVVVTGGTHNGLSPPWPFFERCFLPSLASMGIDVTATCDRAGFFPAGGGQVTLTVQPCSAPSGLRLTALNPDPRLEATVLLSRMHRSVGDDQVRWLRRRVNLAHAEVREVPSPGPGNAVFLKACGGPVDLIFSGFGDRRRRGRAVAEQALDELTAWRASGAPVDEHLADQLLIPLVLAGSGSFRTTRPSLHTQTNLDVLARFTGTRLRVEQEGPDLWRIGH